MEVPGDPGPCGPTPPDGIGDGEPNPDEVADEPGEQNPIGRVLPGHDSVQSPICKDAPLVPLGIGLADVDDVC